jgi:hypothetical protein
MEVQSQDQVQLEQFYQQIVNEKKAVLSLANYTYDSDHEQYHVMTESLPAYSSEIMSALYRGLHRARYNNANLFGRIDGDTLIIEVLSQERPVLVDADDYDFDFDDDDDDDVDDNFDDDDDVDDNFDDDDDVDDNFRLMTIYLPNEIGIALKVFLREPSNSESLGTLTGHLIKYYSENAWVKNHGF